MTVHLKTKQIEHNEAAKFFWNRLRFNEYLNFAGLLVMLMILFNWFVVQHAIIGGIMLLIVFVAFLIDFVLHLKKKQFFLQNIQVHDEVVIARFYSWGKLFNEGQFNRSQISVQLALKKERNITLKLVFVLEGTEITIYEDPNWTKERIIILVDWLIQSCFLILDKESKEYIEMYQETQRLR